MSPQALADRPPKDISLASIPAFPAIALRVLDLVSQEDPDFDLLVREIASDATLSAQVLKLANSAFFGFVTGVGTVQQAVMMLGTRRVQSHIGGYGRLFTSSPPDEGIAKVLETYGCYRSSFP